MDRMSTPTELSPLAQRLLLYRFAIVEFQPGTWLPRYRWGLPFLQQLQAQGAWAKVLEEASPFNLLGLVPVASPSLAALLRVRQRQPDRPLILCRPLFAPPPQISRLRQLVRPAHQVTRVLDPQDPFLPLRWSASLPNQVGHRLNAWFEEHPYQKLARIMRRRNPHSRFDYREDGHLLEQLNLFAEAQPLTVPRTLQDELLSLEWSLRAQLGTPTHCRLIFASNRERLEWFRRDCLRSLPLRFRCIDYPHLPETHDPLPYLVLIHDPSVRMRKLPESLPIFHLDGFSLDLWYRAARVSSGPPGWLNTSPVETAQYRTREGLFRFANHQRGWFSHGGGPSQTTGETAFRRHLELQRLLYQRG